MEKNVEVKIPYYIPTDLMMKAIKSTFFFGTLALVASNFYPWPPVYTGDFLQNVGIEGAIAVYAGLIFFRSSRLLMTAEGVEYTKNFFWQQKVAWHSIRKVQTAVGENRAYFTDIFHEGKEAPNPLPVFIKPYTENGLAVFVALLENKAPHAQMDERTREMKKGVFPSVFFGNSKVAKKAAPIFLAYLMVGAVLFVFPAVFTIADPRVRYGFPVALLLFTLVACWVDGFNWKDIRLGLAVTLWNVAKGGVTLVLFLLVRNWLTSSTIDWNNVCGLVAGYVVYLILAALLSRGR